jgi:hypothetical protein
VKTRGNQGFTLAEFVVALVFVGVVLGPFLVFVVRIQELNSAIGQQGRREAWRSFSDQAVVAGINPSAAPGLQHVVNPAIAAVAPVTVSEIGVAAAPGLPRIVPLHVVNGDDVAETRIAGSGFQIGAGAAAPPRTTPVPPLAPIVMPMPVVTPADGSIIAASSLAAGAAGQPFSTTMEVASSAGAQIHAVLNQPAANLAGFGTVQATLTAVDLASGVNGVAWTEFSGTPEAGDRAVTLEDGRRRWMVLTPEQRLQIYEPSPIARFAYQLDLGAPALVLAGAESRSGTSLPFDYATYAAVGAGTKPLRIDFPKTVKDVFGNTWSAQSVGFQWTFGDQSGEFSGDISPFFRPAALADWADTVPINATPVVPPGAVAAPAQWTFVRVKTPLGAPLLASVPDAAGFASPGELQFSAPAAADGTTIGRLSFQNGTYLSTGTTLSITVIP